MIEYRVDMSPGAKQDLLAAARYIAQESKSLDVAQAWLDGMYATIMGLKEMPQANPLARENDAFAEEVRQKNYQSHRAIYTIHDDMGLVLVHRIWHTAKDKAGPGDLPDVSPG